MSVRVCKFYNINRTCRFGKHCRYLHSASPRPPLLDLNLKEDKYEEHQEDPSYPLVTLALSDKHNIPNQDGPSVTSDHLISQSCQEHTEQSQNECAVQLADGNASKPANKTKTICYYFETYRNCRYGNECKFLHILSDGGYSYKHNQLYKQHTQPGHLSEIPPRFKKTGGQKEDTSTASKKPLVHEESRLRRVINSDYETGCQIAESRGNSSTKRLVCKFFKNGRCYRGDYCQFLHSSNCVSEEQTPSSGPSQHDYREEQIQVNRRENASTAPEHSDVGHRGINRGQRSEYANRASSNFVSRPSLMKQMFTYAELKNADITKVRDSEINTIKKRFPKDKITILEEADSKFSARILFSPSDPDWTFDARVFELLVTMPSSYPREMMNIVLPADQNLPETVRRYVEMSIKEWLDNKVEQLGLSGKVELVFRPFLLWLDRNIEDVTMEALKQLKRELIAQAAGMEFIPADRLQAKLRAQSELCAGKVDEVHSQDGVTVTSYDSDSDHSLEDSDGQEFTLALNIDPEKKGTEIQLRHLQLRENASALIFESLKLVLQCQRCKNHSDVLLTPGKVMSVQCEKCSQNQFIHFRSALVHQFSSVVGYLDMDGCQAFDLTFPDCRVLVTCLGCSKQTHINGLVSGHMVDGWCQACNARFKLATEAVKFVQLMPSSIDTAVNTLVQAASSKQKRPPKDPAIREGWPLPEFGTCKHYKHSYRWLRFPCCGKAYPCDVCHNQKEDHEMVYATRMICGHCCREQNVSAMGRPCSSCGQHLTKVKTPHWEGGSGCRDKVTMSKSDQQKYKNMNKTQSNHQKKVQAGAHKRVTKLRHI